MSMHDVALALKKNLGDKAKNVPTKVLPNWMVRLAALFSPTAKQVVSELGKIKNASNEKAKTWLGWATRTNEEALVATAESLIRMGLVQSPKD